MSDVELFIISGISITAVFSAFLISFLLLNQKRHFKYLKEKNEIENKFSQTLLQSQLEIQEQTLQHVSHELHDNLGQVASLIKINLNTLVLDDNQKAQQKIEHTKELTRQLIGDLKALSVRLGSDRITQVGLVKALETEVERLNKTEAFEASFSIQGKMPAINNDTLIILYRMAQEVLNNIIKHSQARRIKVLLNIDENLVTLALHDDGIGFNPDEKQRSGGAGLLNLQNRAKLINAQLTIQSTPGNGTDIIIQLPL